MSEDLHKFGRAVVELVRGTDDDLNLRQLALVLRVAQTDEWQTVRGLAAHLHINRSAVTRALDRLAVIGLTERRPDPDDGRSVFVSLTPKGRRYVGRLTDVLK